MDDAPGILRRFENALLSDAGCDWTRLESFVQRRIRQSVAPVYIRTLSHPATSLTLKQPFGILDFPFEGA